MVTHPYHTAPHHTAPWRTIKKRNHLKTLCYSISWNSNKFIAVSLFHVPWWYFLVRKSRSRLYPLILLLLNFIFGNNLVTDKCIYISCFFFFLLLLEVKNDNNNTIFSRFWHRSISINGNLILCMEWCHYAEKHLTPLNVECFFFFVCVYCGTLSNGWKTL